MPNEQGRDYRTHVKVGNAFVVIGGETSLTWNRTRAEQDKADKDTGSYGATGHGRQSIAFALSGNLKLPDPGFAALETASKAAVPEVEIQVKKGAVIKFHGLISIGSLRAEYPDGIATFSADMTNAGVPTVDNLTAADPA